MDWEMKMLLRLVRILCVFALISVVSPAVSASSLSVGMDWHWQLQGDVSVPDGAELVELDLFDTPAAKIAAIQNNGVFVLCYFSAGTFEDWREDSHQVPKDDQGADMGDWEGETWWDVRTNSVRNIMMQRLDLAKSKGCDGIEADNVDGYDNETGLDLSEEDAVEFLVWMAKQSHQRGLKIALKNAGSIVEALAPVFDMSVSEQCFEYDNCANYEPFLDAGKPVFNAEYARKFVNNSTAICAQSNDMGISTLVLPLDLKNGFRTTCAQ